MLTEQINEKKYDSWFEEFKKLELIEKEKIIDSEIRPTKPGLTMGEVIRIISEKTNGEAVVVTDVGQHQMIAARYYGFKNSRSFITSGGLGTMGFCLPAAVGAKMGQPDKQVVAIIGDGGFQMTLQELGTILQSGINLKVVILNNNYLGMVRQWQQLFFDKRYSETKMTNPDFVKIASSYNIESEKVTERKDLESVIEKMINSESSFVLEVKVEKEDNVFPMVPSGASVSDIRLE